MQITHVKEKAEHLPAAMNPSSVQLVYGFGVVKPGCGVDPFVMLQRVFHLK